MRSISSSSLSSLTCFSPLLLWLIRKVMSSLVAGVIFPSREGHSISDIHSLSTWSMSSGLRSSSLPESRYRSIWCILCRGDHMYGFVSVEIFDACLRYYIKMNKNISNTAMHARLYALTISHPGLDMYCIVDTLDLLLSCRHLPSVPEQSHVRNRFSRHRDLRRVISYRLLQYPWIRWPRRLPCLPDLAPTV